MLRYVRRRSNIPQLTHNWQEVTDDCRISNYRQLSKFYSSPNIIKGRDSSVRIATNKQLDGPGIECQWGGGEIFRTRSDQPWGSPNLLYDGYRVSFPAVKRPGRGVDHPPPFSTEVKERVQLYVYTPFGPSWIVLGWTLHLPNITGI
jgi:hypothetical protein